LRYLLDPPLQPIDPRLRLGKPAVQLGDLGTELPEGVLGKSHGLLKPHEPILVVAGAAPAMSGHTESPNIAHATAAPPGDAARARGYALTPMNNTAGARMLCLMMVALPGAAALGQPSPPAAPVDNGPYTVRATPLSLALQPQAAPQAAPAPDPQSAAQAFGLKGTEWMAVGGGVANDFSGATDYNLHLEYSQFLIDDIEFGLQLHAWYFDQRGQNAAGINPAMIIRWHFINEDPWSVFGDLGIGVLLSNDNVPDKGTSLDFTPGFGVGLTRRISDSGARLQTGLRWHHISNGRLNGDIRNPARDAPYFYAGVQFPF